MTRPVYAESSLLWKPINTVKRCALSPDRWQLSGIRFSQLQSSPKGTNRRNDRFEYTTGICNHSKPTTREIEVLKFTLWNDCTTMTMSMISTEHQNMRGIHLLGVIAFCTIVVRINLVGAIVQGTQDTGNNYSRVCALLQQKPGGGYDIRCSAVMISPTVLISAAHCAGEFSFVSCEPTVSGSSQILDVASTEQHQSYSDAQNDLPEDRKQDLLVVKLSKPYNPPGGFAALPKQQVLNDMLQTGTLADGASFIIVGYGGTDIITDPQADAGVSQNKDRYYTNATSRRLASDRLELSVSLASGSGGSICRGDSGGGVFDANTGVLVGITSRADALCTREAIANRVDTSAVRSWLAIQGVTPP